MPQTKFECLICGRLWKSPTLRMVQKLTCSKSCASIKGYLSGNHKETGIELKLQGLLLSMGIEFVTQKPLLGVTVVDIFVFPNVAIFADGSYWHSGSEKEYRDSEKTRKLKKAGYVVLRLDEKEINKDVETVKKKLLEAYSCRRVKKEL